MHFGKTPREGEGRVTTWSYEKVFEGQTFQAFIAGPVVWVYGHQQNYFKPCADFLTGSAVECFCGGRAKNLRWHGYLPLYNQDGKPMVVGVKDHSQEQIESIRLFCAVTVGRNKGDKQPVWVREMKGARRYASDRPERQGPADIKWWLLRLWKIPELEAYYTAHPELLDTPKQETSTSPAVAVPAIDENDPDVVKLRKLMATTDTPKDRAAVDQKPTQPITDYVRSLPVYERLAPQQARKNGKHKKEAP